MGEDCAVSRSLVLCLSLCGVTARYSRLRVFLPTDSQSLLSKIGLNFLGRINADVPRLLQFFVAYQITFVHVIFIPSDVTH